MTSRELWFLHLLWSMLIAFAVTQIDPATDEAHCLNDCNPLPILAPIKKPSYGGVIGAVGGAFYTPTAASGTACTMAMAVPGSTSGAMMTVATPCTISSGSAQ